MPLPATDFILPGVPEDGYLKTVLTRYDFPISTSAGEPKERLSLILNHAVSMHKESWLPTLEYLAQIQQIAPNNAFCIVEAWVMDCPNHGRAGIVNEDKLMTRPNGISAYVWAGAVQRLLNSGLIRGNSVVGIGHSAGACVMILATSGYPPYRLPFSSLIMVDPPMMTQELLAKAKTQNTPLLAAVEEAKMRKDIWPSRDAAREWFSKRLPYKLWTPEVLQLFVEYALRDLPTATYPDKKEGVTLACTRVQETAGYVYFQDAFDGLERLKDLCPAIPVHCIFGKRIDMVPAEVQAAIIDPAQGRKMASVSRVAGAGHLVVQEHPKNLAVALWGALHHGRTEQGRL